MNRRGFLSSLGVSLVAAPAVLKLGLWMPVRKIVEPLPSWPRNRWPQFVPGDMVLLSHDISEPVAAHRVRTVYSLSADGRMLRLSGGSEVYLTDVRVTRIRDYLDGVVDIT